jgi:hypothetical protein
VSKILFKTREQKNPKKFGAFKKGECFEHEGKIYMTASKYPLAKPDVPLQAVELSSGNVTSFGEDMLVTPMVIRATVLDEPEHRDDTTLDDWKFGESYIGLPYGVPIQFDPEEDK